MAMQATDELTILQTALSLNDPHINTDDKNKLSILAALYEPLVWLGEEGAFQPALAESWTLSDDARTWTFNLRAGVKLHNGQTLSAQDVLDSLQRVLDPNMGGELGTGGLFFTYLGDAEIDAPDELKVVLKKPVPNADLLDILMKIPIVPAAAYDNLPDSPIGSGPYRLLEVRDDTIIMEAHQEYWGGKPPAKRLVWRAEPDENKRIDALLAGKADIISDLRPAAASAVEAKAGCQLVNAQSSVCATFMYNCSFGVCRDKRIRQALNYALDVPELIDEVMGGAARPTNGPFTSLHLGYDPDTPIYPYDPDTAAKLLSQAGYLDDLEITLDIPTIYPDEAPALAVAMARQFARVGVTTVVRHYENRPAYANMVRNKQIHDAACFDSSPQSTYQVMREKFHSGIQGPWWQGYDNPQVNQLIDKAVATADINARRKIYQQAYRIIRDDAAWIFLYSHIYYWGVGPKAAGWQAGFDGLVRVR